MKKIDKYKQRAMQAVQSNQLDDAVGWLQKARELSGNDIDVLRLSAQVSGQLGRFDETSKYCERILALNSGDAMAWAFLGNARMASAEYELALAAFDKALVLAPNTPMILVNRGSALFLLNRYDEAIGCLRRAIQLAPGTANAYFNLGRIYKTLGDFTQAATQFELAIRYDPDLADAYINLSGILFAMGRLDDAERVALNAIQTHPEIVNYRNCLVNLYMYRGEYDRALAECDTILEHAADNYAAKGSKASLLERRGEFEKAYEIIRELVDSGQLDVSGAEVYVKLCGRFDDCDRAVHCIQAMLQKESLDENRRSLNFALGYLLNRLHRYEEAFEHYRRANQLSCVDYDFDEQVRKFESLKTVFSSENFGSLPKAANRSERPVFVVGMPRSGTSLVEQILASHPDVYGAGELEDMNKLIGSVQAVTRSPNDFPECVTDLDAPRADQLANTYLAILDGLSADALRVVDKMPHNFRYLGMIAILFPGARIIHCRRDPRDTCLSIYFQSFNQTHAYGADLTTLGKYYREYEKLMEHWKSVLDMPVYEIHYADLVADQEKYSRELIEFCGLDWNEQCLSFHETGRDVATASYDQVRRPMYKSSLERWRCYEPFIQPLLDELDLASARK